MSTDIIWYKSESLATDTTPPLVAGDDDTLANDLELDVTTNYLLLSVTQDQYVRMLSALLNGAYKTYPLDFMEVIYPLIKAGKVTLCDAIAECISDTPAIQQQIAQYSLGPSIPQDGAERQENLDFQLINDPAGCDNDMIFGMASGLTDLLNAISEDILQMFVDAASPAGRIGDMIEAIPIVGEAPLDDLFQLAESMMVDINDSYLSEYTTQVRDDIRCDLFCLAQDGCILTLEQVRDYFYDKLGESISLSLWNGFLDDIVSHAYSGVFTIWSLHLLITQTIIFGGELVGFDVNRLGRTIQSLYNDPDSDWETVCDVCPDPIYYLELDATTSQGGVHLQTAVWNSGTGFQEVDATGVSRCYIVYITDDLWTNSYIEMRFTKIPSTTTGFRDLLTRYAPVNQSFKTITTGAETDPFETWSNSYEKGNSNKFRWRINSSPQNSNIVINRLRVTIHSTEFPQVWVDDGWEVYTP